MAEVSFNETLESEACANVVYNWDHIKCSREAKLENEAKWKLVLGRIKRKLPFLNLNQNRDFVLKSRYRAGVFSGQVENSVRSGIGYCKFFSGIKYFGEWSKGVPNGQGYLFISKKSHYKGSFSSGKFDGYGEFVDGENYYKGQWLSDQKNGLGEERAGSFYYKGEFKLGKKHGKGVLKNLNGSYKGIFENGELKSGNFKPISKTYSCSGIWEKGEMSGQASLKLHNSSVKKIRANFRKNTLVSGVLLFSDQRKMSISSKIKNY